MELGVNIHPQYNVPIPDFLSVAKDIGMSTVRVDIYDSTALTKGYLTTLRAAASTLGIGVIAVLIPSAAASTSESAAYTWGKNNAKSLAQSFPDMTWEAGNELDQFCIKAGVDGTLPSHYDNVKYYKVRGAIRGMYDGFKQGSPNCVVGVGTSGDNFGFLQRLKNDNVNWDITTTHFYIMPGATDISVGAPVYLAKLAAFGKPIAFTEYHQQDGSNLSQNTQTLIDLTQALYDNRNTYNIVAIYVYELLDEPNLVPNEAHYGLASSTGIINQFGLDLKAWKQNH